MLCRETHQATEKSPSSVPLSPIAGARKLLDPSQRSAEMQKRNLLVALAITLLAVLPACAQPEPEIVEATREMVVPQTVEVTREVTKVVEKIVRETVEVTRVEQVVVTATPEPATPTPEPAPTLAFQRWTSNQVVEAFKAAGLEAEDARPMTKDDYGMAPMVAVEGMRFFIPSLCEDCGGRVLGFASSEDLEKTKAFYVRLGEESAMLFSWVFTRDNILVQINGDLPEETALKYKVALESLE
jgi:hypothetical protein